MVVETSGPDDAERLKTIGLRLQRAAHPGVVAVVDSGPTPDGGWRLRTAHGGGPISTITNLSASRLAAIGAGVAATLADLHALGVVHGRVNEHRILLGEHGRPVLSSFGPEPVGLGPEDDVSALGLALRVMLGGDPSIAGSRNRGRGNDPRSALAAVIETATDANPARRPSMRRLAASLAELAAPPAHRAKADRTGARPSRPARRRSSGPPPHRRLASGRGPLVTVGLLIVLAAAAVLQVRPAAAPPEDPLGAGTAATSRAEPRPESGGAPSCVVFSDRPIDRHDRSCPHRISISDRVVVIDGQRYRVGDPGDQVAVGSFSCAGDATIAVLRPSTGDVFVFSEAGSDAQDVPAVTSVSDAVGLRALAISDRCQQLRVVDAHGTITPVDLTDQL